MTLSISSIDLSLLVAYLVGVVAFGLWVGRGQRNTTDYFLGGQSLPWLAVLLSIVATETSTVTFLSIPGLPLAEGGNLTFLQLAIGYILGRWLVTWFLLPLYFEGRLFTSYEVLNRRFGGPTKQTASLMFLVTRNGADGLRLFLTALVLEQVLGWSLAWCVVAIGLTTIVYTLFGGLKSVVWNDCIQFVVYMLGGVLAFWVILDKLPGGWEQMMEFGSKTGRLQVIDLGFDPQADQSPLAVCLQILGKSYTLWAGVLGGIFVTLGSHGTDQLMVQRYLAARSLRSAGLALSLSGIVVFLQFAFFLMLGVALACFYQEYPPGAAMDKTDKALAAFIVDHMPVGAVGITLAAVFSAAMSTLSSSLSSSASSAVNDLGLPLLGTRPSETTLLTASRLLTVVFGVVQMGVALLGPLTDRAIIESVMAIQSISIGVILGLFLLALRRRRTVSQRAALGGLWGGLAIVCLLAFNKYLLPAGKAIPVGWPWFAVFGSLSVFLIGVGLSYVWPVRKVS